MSAENAADQMLLVGVDGGATEVKAHHVRCADFARADGFSLGTAHAARKYERLPEFEPLPVGEQLAQRDADRLQLGAKESIQGSMLVQAAAEAIAEVARAAGGDKAGPVLVGMGMPGLKTPDQRGIAVINNGPRIPDFLEQLEQRLAEQKIQLAAPIAALGSDADYCGIGEEYAAEGVFRDVTSAYYVGCGTGIADALKLNGKLVTFDASKAWLQKSWQIPSTVGATFEKLVSAKSMNDAYARLLGMEALDEPRYPEVEAAGGHALAQAWMQTVAAIMAELIYERLNTIYDGRRDSAARGEAYAALDTTHPYIGTTLDRVVLGQRLGQIFGDRRYRGVFREPLEGCLAAMIVAGGEDALATAYMEGKALKSDFLCSSRSRAAPALGAGVAAVHALST